MQKSDRRAFIKQVGAAFALASAGAPRGAAQIDPGAGQRAKNGVRVLDFESRVAYRSSHHPEYAAWATLFPGEGGKWYLACYEMSRPATAPRRISPDQLYAFSFPDHYDDSRLRHERVLLESNDNLRSWRVISREAVGRAVYPAQAFGQARTKDGRFLRFIWTAYLLDNPSPGEIFYVSDDDGGTWRKQPPFHSRDFVSYAHRLRTLRDGTLVLALPLSPGFGPGTDLPTRACMDLRADVSLQMTLTFSGDQGRTWSNPLPIYGGQTVSETDFVEMPSGDLLCINNSIFAHPGRQIIKRTPQGWIPKPFEKSLSKIVPETVAMKEDGFLVGCLRAGRYFWSDDLGLSWYPLEGIPAEVARNRECYQPWIEHLGAGRFACAGHNGGDDYYGRLGQHIQIHFFTVEVLEKTKNTRLELVREFDSGHSRWRNSYRLLLTCDGQPLKDKQVEFWFVERNAPGYDSWNKVPLEERMKTGGEIITATTGAGGEARVSLSRFDSITDIGHDIQIVVLFNLDRRYPEYKPAQTPQFQFYSLAEY